MKCKNCDSYFTLETRFSNLFVFEEVCSECKKLDLVKPKLEVIPIDQGEIQYIYLYDDLFVNYKRVEYLRKNYRILFKTLLKESNTKLVIIIDDFIYSDLKNELKYVTSFKQIIFMSVFRYSFESFVNF